MKDFCVFIGGEVTHVLAPFRDGISHAADQLLDTAFTLLRTHLAVEIFGDHDVGSGLRPRLGNLDVLLLKDHLSFFIGDSRAAQFPFHVIKRMNAFLGEETFEFQTTFTGKSIRPDKSLGSDNRLSGLGHRSS